METDGPPRTAERNTEPFQNAIYMVGGLLVWGLIALGIASIVSTRARDFAAQNWLIILLALLSMPLLFWLNSWIRKQRKKQGALFAFLVIPLITISMLGVIVLGTRHMNLVMELIIVLVAALIPAAAYYLFIATRRPSILNEFITNLNGLGLLARRKVRRMKKLGADRYAPVFDRETRTEWRSRLEGYLQNFEAIYGVLRFETKKDVGTEMPSVTEVDRAAFVEHLTAVLDRDQQAESDLSVPQGSVQIRDIFRANIIIPVGMLTVLTTFGWLMVLQPGFSSTADVVPAADTTPTAVVARPADSAPAAAVSRVGNIARITPTMTPINFVFLGAYFFGIQMLYRRFARRDLSPNAYIAFSNRIILSMISVWVALLVLESFADSSLLGLGSIDNELEGRLDGSSSSTPWPAYALVTAFIVGVFPRILWQLLGAFFKKIFFIKLFLPAVESKQPLSELDGLTIWHESRLMEEDVENVPNMATVDIVDILLHTQIPAERVVSWIDQAILCNVLGPKTEEKKNGGGKQTSRNKLHQLGLRKASQVVQVYRDQGPDHDVLVASLGENIHSLVAAIELESNFGIITAWRNIPEPVRPDMPAEENKIAATPATAADASDLPAQRH